MELDRESSVTQKRFLIKYVKNIIIHLLIQRCSSVELLSTFTVSRSDTCVEGIWRSEVRFQITQYN